MKSRLSLLLILGLMVMLVGGVVADNVRTRVTTAPPPNAADMLRPEEQVHSEPGTGEKAATVLPSEYIELNKQYKEQIAALEVRLSPPQTESEGRSVQEQIMALKHGYKVARLNLALEQARAEGKIEAESRILEALDNLTNRPVHTPLNVPRDPVTGKALEGGAR